MHKNHVILLWKTIRMTKSYQAAFKECRFANELVVARDGQEALITCMQPVNIRAGCLRQPQLVLLDLKLPKMDGLEAMQRIRAIKGQSFCPWLS